MIKKHILLMFVMTFILTACSLFQKDENKREVFANEEGMITLQNLKTRVIINCYANEYQSAEECAKAYELTDYVRTRDIPNKPAQYDFLKGDSYPTRRWREGEVSPRW